MRTVTAAVVVLGVVAAAGATLTDEDKNGRQGTGVSHASEDRLEEDRRGVRLFAYSTTTSIKRLATTTITAISTCLSISGSTQCTGRRKRSHFSDLVNLDEMSELDALYGSQLEAEESGFGGGFGGSEGGQEGEEEVEEVVEEKNKDGTAKKRMVKGDKKARKLTIISSMISTLTLTSTSYLTGTTVTATAFCIAPGLTAGCFGK